MEQWLPATLETEQYLEKWAIIVPSHTWCLPRRGNNCLMLLHITAAVLGDCSPCCSLAVPVGILC